MIIVLDTGVVGSLCRVNPQNEASFGEAWDWLEGLRTAGHVVVLPEIADYEARRGFLRMNWERALGSLARLEYLLWYQPITTATMRVAAHLWASSRQLGRSSGPERALDADVILAAQTREMEKQGHRCVVATTNVRHLSWYVDARQWETITPAALSD